MTAWFLNLIGVRGDIASDAANVTFHWHRPACLFVGLALLPALTWWIARRHRVGLPLVDARRRRVLTVCRAGVALLLIVILAGPFVQLDRADENRARLIVLIDESASMSLPAGPWSKAELDRLTRTLRKDSGDAVVPLPSEMLTSLTRDQLLTHALTAQHAAMDELSQRYRVRTYRFARAARAAVHDENPDALSAGDVQETNLGAALQRALSDAAGRPVAGVVILSDGQWTTGPDARAILAGAAAASGQSIPVFVVPAGSAAPPADVVVLDVLAPPRVARGDEAAVIATIDSTGFSGGSIQVQLLEGDREIDRATVHLRDRSPQQVQLMLRDTREAGPRSLRVVAAAQPEEIVAANNALACLIGVESGRRRLLVVEGAPRWDFRFLDHALRRDRGIESTIIMEASLLASGVGEAGLVAASGLPRDVEGFAKYDAVLLGDVSPAMLPEAAQEALGRAVKERGVGLIVQAGTQAMPHAFAQGELAELLPVTIASPSPRTIEGAGGEVLVVDGLEARPGEPFVLKATAQGITHLAMQLYDDATSTRAAWDAMPAFYWMAAARQAKPGATVLAEVFTGGNPGARTPLIAEHRVGKGRVLFVGTDSTYLWRRNAGDALFDRFWGQAIRRVARSERDADDRSWIDATPGIAEPGKPVRIEAHVSAASASAGEVAMMIRADKSEQRIILAPLADAGYFQGSWVPYAPGEFTLTLDGSDPPVSTTVRVAASGRELLDPSVNREALGLLADQTGGALLEVDELRRLPSLLPDRPTTSVARPVEQDVWDNWLTLALLVGLFCIDIATRRIIGVM